jgi:hypothetical protein
MNNHFGEPGWPGVGFSGLSLVRREKCRLRAANNSIAYVELGISSPFSFLRGASDRSSWC